MATKDFLGTSQQLINDGKLIYNSGTKYVQNSSGLLVPGTTLRTHHDGNGAPLGWLVEGAATNYLQHSEAMNTSPWVNNFNGVIDTNIIAAPDGTLTGNRFKDDGSTGSSTPQFYQVPTSVAGDQTFSCYMKQGSLRYSALRSLAWDAAANGFSYFDLQDGVVVSEFSGHKARITSAHNGWWRCSISFDSPVINNGWCLGYMSPDGANVTVTLDGTNNIYVWGAMLNTGNFPHSYIKTEGATEAVVADNFYIDLTHLPYDQKKGTIISKWAVSYEAPHVGGVFEFRDAVNPSPLSFIRSYNFDVAVMQVYDGGILQVGTNPTNNYTDGAPGISALRYKRNDFGMVLNNGTIQKDTSGTIDTPLTRLNIATYNSLRLGGILEYLKYVPRHMSDEHMGLETVL